MFVVCFGDGLGNQMFQYAFYKALKMRYPKNKVKMDVFRIYGGNIHNGFELQRVFGIEVDDCGKRMAFRLAEHWPKHEKKYWLMNKLLGLRGYIWGPKESYITQDDPTEYYEEVFQLSTLHSYMFRGNWVNEKYFGELREEIVKDFSFPQLSSSSNLNYAKLMKEVNSISVHIRRGDYINSGMLNLGKEYYIKAKKIIEKKVENPTYFIFTDDKDEIDEYIRLFNNAIIVEGNTKEDSYIDMQLMSLCKHNIIANSTFSFWGAYLNCNPKKVVVAPNKAKYDFRNPFACSEWNIISYDGK